MKGKRRPRAGRRGIMFSRLLVPFTLLLMGSPLMAQHGERGLVLTLSGPHTIHVGEYADFAVTISNRGPHSVSLVQPGDGSNCRMRTPVIGWSVLSSDAKGQKHPQVAPPFHGVRTCGMINAIKRSEVFSLTPGASIRLANWTADPKFETPGKFRLVFYYENIPDLKIAGFPLGPHDDDVLGQIKRSTRCRLVSEEVLLDVLPARGAAKP